jgi:hypothetical protein
MVVGGYEYKQEPRIKGASLCNKCGAEYINNGGLIKGFRLEGVSGTSEGRFLKTKDIPEGVCPICY